MNKNELKENDVVIPSTEEKKQTASGSMVKFMDIRVFYNKLSRAKYISHLDITRCMQRALKRAELPVWYTEGFNPHIYLTFALPLSLGYESESEVMDLRLIEEMSFDEVKDRLNNALPPDIRVTKVDVQQKKSDAIKTALYNITLSSETYSGQILNDCLYNFLEQDKIEVVKRTKKGNKTIDIKPDVTVNSIEIMDNAINISLTAAAGIDKNINPTLLTDEIKGKYNIEDMQTAVIRKAILDENGEEFR